jgi:FixJ family two-component response regulator
VVMPHMNGRALAQELNQRRPDMRVLYMSGYADDAILEQGTLAPGAIFLAKPFSVESLVQKVRAVLDNRL